MGWGGLEWEGFGVWGSKSLTRHAAKRCRDVLRSSESLYCFVFFNGKLFQMEGSMREEVGGR